MKNYDQQINLLIKATMVIHSSSTMSSWTMMMARAMTKVKVLAWEWWTVKAMVRPIENAHNSWERPGTIEKRLKEQLLLKLLFATLLDGNFNTLDFASVHGKLSFLCINKIWHVRWDPKLEAMGCCVAKITFQEVKVLPGTVWHGSKQLGDALE
jgi:hypothetical protein